MTLKRLTDFRAKPAWWEYCVFYLFTSVNLVLFGMAYSGILPVLWSWLCAVVLLVTVTIFAQLYLTRTRRSQAFFQEWLNSFDNHQLECLKVRFANSYREHRMIEDILQIRGRIDQ